MSETPTGSRSGRTPPPALTRSSRSQGGHWTSVFMPPFAAGRTLSGRSAPAPVEAVSSEPPPGSLTFEFAAPVSAGTPASEADWSAPQLTAEFVDPDDTVPPELPLEDMTIEKSSTEGTAVVAETADPWTPDSWAVPDWLDTPQQQPASEAAAFDGWSGPQPQQDAEPDAQLDGLDASPEAVDAPLEALDAPLDDDVAQRVAQRLDELARQIRTRGLGALGGRHDADELSRVIAAVVAGYLGRAD